MFSGKSEELIRRVRRAIIARKRVQVFKSHLDGRYAGIYAISSHDGRSVEAVPVDSSAQIAQCLDPMAQVIAIDEAQFLDDSIVDLTTSLAARGRRVILAGTDTDFRGEPFGPMPQLMAVAEVVDKLHAICVLCGVSGEPEPATGRGPPGALRLSSDSGGWNESRMRHAAVRATRFLGGTRIREGCCREGRAGNGKREPGNGEPSGCLILQRDEASRRVYRP